MSRSGMEMKEMVRRLPEGQRTGYSKRFARAHDILDQLVESLAAQPFTPRMVDKPMQSIVGDSARVQECELLLQSMLLTDFRAGIPTEVLMKPPRPSCWSKITSFHPIGSGEMTNLMNVGAADFVVLLAATIRLHMAGSAPKAHILRMCLELFAHAANGVLSGCMPCGLTLTGAEVRLALAMLGVKIARKLYRAAPEQRSDYGEIGRQIGMDEMPLDPALETAALLDTVEAFALEQCAAAPEHPVGHWNRGWVAQQSAAVRGVNGLAAAADCYEHMERCYKLADLADHDIYKAAARVEACCCLALGAAGLVGWTAEGLPGGHARRDLRSSYAR
jgi:hypothetical protein